MRNRRPVKKYRRFYAVRVSSSFAEINAVMGKGEARRFLKQMEVLQNTIYDHEFRRHGNDFDPKNLRMEVTVTAPGDTYVKLEETVAP